MTPATTRWTLIIPLDGRTPAPGGWVLVCKTSGELGPANSPWPLTVSNRFSALIPRRTGPGAAVAAARAWVLAVARLATLDTHMVLMSGALMAGPLVCLLPQTIFPAVVRSSGGRARPRARRSCPALATRAGHLAGATAVQMVQGPRAALAAGATRVRRHRLGHSSCQTGAPALPVPRIAA
jgi:hypothetical protein